MGHNLRTSRRHGRRQNQLMDYNTPVTAPNTTESWEERLQRLEEAIMPQTDSNAAQYQEKMCAASDRKGQKKYVNF
ncbi:hypothetical protein SARC_00655 [Sphaeroforma arctica JP610]|uniref:Uncharacterized protein n=1 Tax=Sphaeroforma arctica JP610 TaxID=667725 RepID=A0A0L0GDY2_9EUKA|nr:hypothetical protein SARC_00655 [Sphaeroforma arctica JP610]KNC87220.1 hypothetical protein SARC_00655 [Sphaeroforma arctica JP610]|eukprot:XP_014161122.1 hypothetical protein SARC_00655 [Sphaeroforma arctica JP610]